ncbi:MAG: DinB family protein, partial [Aureliella sp.]
MLKPQPVSELSIAERYRRVRDFSKQLCGHLEPEDCVVQSMTEASPLRWHLAHTSWFFETFILKQLDGYQPLVDQYAYLFNSYYNALGDQFPREQRGVLSRPTMRQVWNYRQYVDGKLLEGLASGSIEAAGGLDLVELGLQHEQQHQELMLTDIKHAFSCNPLLPAYSDSPLSSAEKRGSAQAKPLKYVSLDGGLIEIGHIERSGFAYDNELPRHTVYLDSFQLANRAARCGEYLRFIEDGGYARPELWL